MGGGNKRGGIIWTRDEETEGRSGRDEAGGKGKRRLGRKEKDRLRGGGDMKRK